MTKAWMRELRHPASWVLLAALAVGTGARILLSVRWRPAFIGYPDSGIYLLDAFDPQGPFYDPLRPIGYGLYLRGLHGLRPDLLAVPVSQHLIAIGAAATLMLALRAGDVRSRWVAIAPAVVLLLSGGLIFLEHALLSETLWLGMFSVTLLAITLAARTSSLKSAAAWAAVAGAVLGLSVPVRLTGLFAIPVLAIWLFASAQGRLGRRLIVLASASVPCAALILGFMAWQQAETGQFTLTRNGVLNFYARVAPWADCAKFTPPRGSEFLCERSDPKQRVGHDAYIFAPSPATRRYPLPGPNVPLPPKGAKLISKWSRAAVLGQPLTYLHAVASELPRLIDPGIKGGLPGQRYFGSGVAPAAYPTLLQSADRDAYNVPLIERVYDTIGFVRGDVRPIERLEQWTRPPPLGMALLLALCLVAPLVSRGSQRRVALLWSSTALSLLIMPIVISVYDARYVIPVMPILVGAAAIGAWSVAVAAIRWRKDRDDDQSSRADVQGSSAT